MSTDFFLDAPSPFVLLDAARGLSSPPGLTAWRRCEGVPFWQVLEAAAQAAALQQRGARSTDSRKAWQEKSRATRCCRAAA